MASQTGMAAPAIAALVGSVESHVGKVIHAFNEEGLDSLDPTTGRAPQEDDARRA